MTGVIQCLSHSRYPSFCSAFSLLLWLITWVSWWIPPGINPQWKTRNIKYGLIMQVLLNNAPAHTAWSIREWGRDVTFIKLCLILCYWNMWCTCLGFIFMCEHLGEGAGGEVGLFSVDSSDPPISSGRLLGEQCPDGGKYDTFKCHI